MTEYFNKRTGDRVEIKGRSARLDALDNWQIVDGTETPTVVNDGVLSRPTLIAPGVHDPSADVPATNEGLRKENPGGTGQVVGQELTVIEPGGDDLVIKAPAKNAGLAKWQEYAAKVEDDPERQSDIAGLTKDELVARYGGGS
ncbi:hypothetical protein GCM10010372_30600 [Streptomyces tauricus]|uniref:hypothetical protein n=1 Tax=Streptomyces tauricus TaxID=68274 RepID=UPI00167BA40D|nr:hypothetical protein [Streptomyces tauricus]GHA28685.1 hypothetical protein GCM10010372_30600 [Streptomyces tauricus]